MNQIPLRSEFDPMGDTLLEKLDAEQAIHKNHRQEFVRWKLLTVAGTYGLSAIGGIDGVEVQTGPVMLLVAPLIALGYDIFIFAEDFKVKRIGQFFQSIQSGELTGAWERYVSKQRDGMAVFGSFAITVGVFLLSVGLLHLANDDTSRKLVDMPWVAKLLPLWMAGVGLGLLWAFGTGRLQTLRLNPDWDYIQWLHTRLSSPWVLYRYWRDNTDRWPWWVQVMDFPVALVLGLLALTRLGVVLVDVLTIGATCLLNAVILPDWPTKRSARWQPYPLQ